MASFDHIKGYTAMMARWKASGMKLHDVTEQALLDGADKITETMRYMVPVETGKTRRTIKHTPVLTSRKGNSYVVVSAGDDSTLIPGKDGQMHQLARMLEYGTEDRPAQPFLRLAMRLNRSAVRAGIRKAMREAIKVANGD